MMTANVSSSRALKTMLLSCGGVAMSAGLISKAQAQEVIAPEAVGTALPSITEIIVTATKRAERLQDLPISIAAVTSEQLASRNVLDLQGIASITPAFRHQEGRSPSFSNYSIRGITTFTATPGVDTAVGISVDGVPLARVTAAPTNLVDVERVEILRGPQGSLFGKNASAGVVNIVSKGVDLDERSFSGRLYYGSYDEVRAEGAVNLAISSTFGLRIAAWNFRHDGFINNLRTDAKVGAVDNQGVRVKAKFQPDPNLTINVTGEVINNHADGPIPTLRHVVSNDPNGLTASDLALGIEPGPDNLNGADGGRPNDFRINNKSLTAQIDWEIGALTLTSLTGYRKTDDDSIYDPLSVGGNANGVEYDLLTTEGLSNYDQFSTELRLASSSTGRLRYVVGAFYSNLNLTQRGSQFVPARVIPILPIPVSRATNLDLSSKSFSIFGQGTFEITDALKIIAGGRYNWDRVEGTFLRDYLVPPVAPVGPSAPGASFGPFQAAREIKADRGTVTVGAQYSISRDVMTYATYSTGYHGPGLAFNIDSTAATIAPPANGLVQPETSTMYEAGLKSQWFDRRLTLNIAVYRENFKNFQTEARVQGLVPVFSTINADELRSSGVEFEYSVRPFDGFSISGFIAYNDAKFVKFPNAPCFGGQTPAEGCVGGMQDLSGVSLSLAPEWTHGATAQFETDIGSDFTGIIQGGYSYVGAQTYENTRDPYKAQDSYVTVDASVGVASSDKRWSLTAYVSNLFKANFVGAITARDAVGGRSYTNYPVYGATRRFGVALGMNF